MDSYVDIGLHAEWLNDFSRRQGGVRFNMSTR